MDELERRARPRRPQYGEILVEGTLGTERGMVTDISEDGVFALLPAARLAVGDEVTLEFRDPRLDRFVRAAAVVSRIASGDGDSGVGFLLVESVAFEARDRRRSSRIQCSLAAELVTGSGRIRAAMVDISIAGCAIETNGRVRSGPARLVFAHPGTGKIATARALVTSTARRDPDSGRMRTAGSGAPETTRPKW